MESHFLPEAWESFLIAIKETKIIRAQLMIIFLTIALNFRTNRVFWIFLTIAIGVETLAYIDPSHLHDITSGIVVVVLFPAIILFALSLDRHTKAIKNNRRLRNDLKDRFNVDKGDTDD